LPKANGTVNWFGYSNPDVDKLMLQAISTVKDADRAKLVQEVSRKVMQDEHAVLSIVGLKFLYATNAAVGFRPRLDGYITAMQLDP
jgi:peptide/nickel transport system substrate-binding protein